MGRGREKEGRIGGGNLGREESVARAGRRAAEQRQGCHCREAVALAEVARATLRFLPLTLILVSVGLLEPWEIEYHPPQTSREEGRRVERQ